VVRLKRVTGSFRYGHHVGHDMSRGRLKPWFEPYFVIDEASDFRHQVVVKDDQAALGHQRRPEFEVTAGAFVRMIGVDEKHANRATSVSVDRLGGEADERLDDVLYTCLPDPIAECL
jgi:hypothetical protein